MLHAKVSIHYRANALKHEKNACAILMCGDCNTRLNWEKKDVLEKHYKSRETLKCQATVKGIIENKKCAKIKKSVFVEDIVKIVMQKNIKN
ncbi:hypothetical protein PR048_023420 [Dryococelus australis]|uniref:Uncharacterized protein n=1 Tax=Dryococelus australis TaxID=614101 RepID=A0ABQ9GU16_9NEOP|nr:hypothetical protein PR048_023420 [Dryococelus australis]